MRLPGHIVTFMVIIIFDLGHSKTVHWREFIISLAAWKAQFYLTKLSSPRHKLG